MLGPQRARTERPWLMRPQRARLLRRVGARFLGR